MRKLLVVIFTLVLAATGQHFAGMGAFRMPSVAHVKPLATEFVCPMASACPMLIDSLDLTQSPLTKFWTVFSSLAAAVLCLIFNGYQTAYAPRVAWKNAEPAVFQSLVKRELNKKSAEMADFLLVNNLTLEKCSFFCYDKAN